MEGRRYERVAVAIREEITEIIAYELEDPRLSGLEVTDVQVSPDMKKCVVTVFTGVEGEESEKLIQLLRAAKGFLRNELSQRVDIHHIPELYFDAALNLGSRDRVNQLLKRMRRGRPKD